MVVAFVFPVQLPFHLTVLTMASNPQIALALALQTLTSITVALRYQRLQHVSPIGEFSSLYSSPSVADI